MTTDDLPLLVALIVVAAFIGNWLDRRAEKKRNALAFEQFNSQLGVHPADDVYELDSWPLIEKWLKDNPEKSEQYLRDAMSHRGKGKR